MFLSGKTVYDRHGEQKHTGMFLALFSHHRYKWCEETGKSWSDIPNGLERELYAYVGKMSMHPFGNFMMGSLRIGNSYVRCSGTYGSDGLTVDYEKVPVVARKHLVKVPDDVRDMFWSGKGGHNSAGSEGPAMYAYGMSLLNEKKRKKQ